MGSDFRLPTSDFRQFRERGRLNVSPLKARPRRKKQHLRLLENRLDKALIKYNEAQSIRKTYEQIVKRLREERIGFDNQLGALERTLHAKEADLEELMLMSHDATHAKEVAKAELVRVDAMLQAERQKRERELTERRVQVRARQDMAAKMEKRERTRLDIQQEAKGDLSEAQEQALRQTAVTNQLNSEANHAGRWLQHSHFSCTAKQPRLHATPRDASRTLGSLQLLRHA